MPDLIYSRSVSASELPMSAIHSKASAAFTELPIEGVSANYGHLRTIDLLPVLKDYGYLPVQAAQTTARKKDKIGHQNHMLAFAHENDLLQPSDGRPEIIIYNSSDRSSALKCFAGYFRGICSNGLVAGDGFQNKVYHNIKNIANFEDQLRDMVARLPEMLGLVEKMKSTLIDGQTGLEIAESGASLRWANWEQEQFRAWKSNKEDREKSKSWGNSDPQYARGSYYTEQTISDLLDSKRPGERSLAKQTASLWHVFNRVQEGLIRGKTEIQSVSNLRPSGTTRKATGLTSVPKSVKVNREFWDVAAAYA